MTTAPGRTGFGCTEFVLLCEMRGSTMVVETVFEFRLRFVVSVHSTVAWLVRFCPRVLAETSATLVDYVPLPHVMQTVILPMAQAAGFVEVSVPKPRGEGAPNGTGENVEAWPDSTPVQAS